MTGLIITLLLGGFIGLGALISHWTRNNQTVVHISVSIALGTLATLALVELLPESLEHVGNDHWWVVLIGAVVGLGALMLLDKFMPDHDAEGGHAHGHGHDHAKHGEEHLGVMSAIAVTLHNIIEGMAVYSVAEEDLVTGLLVALGVGLHNIPMGMIIFTSLRGHKKEQVAMVGLASISTFLGGLLMALLWQFISDFTVGVLIAVTLGMILYIVIWELLPTVLKEENKKISVWGTIIGIAIILVSTLFE